MAKPGELAQSVILVLNPRELHVVISCLESSRDILDKPGPGRSPRLTQEVNTVLLSILTETVIQLETTE